jgi:multiple sugar transport system substrate-binding protein
MSSQRSLSRRDFLRLTGVTLAAVAAGACVAPAPAPAPAAAPAATQPAAAPTAASAAPTAAPAASQATLRVGHWWGDAFNDAIALFGKTHPNITVKNEVSPWDGYHDKLPTQIAAGNAPDVNFMDSGYFGVMLPQGVALSLNEYLKSDQDIKPDKWAIDPAVDTGYGGTAYGVPQWHPDSANIVVNLDLFDKAGIKAPAYGSADFMKLDWDKFVEAAKALTKQTSDGKFEQWGLGGVGRAVWSPHRDMVWTNGGEFFDDTSAMKPTKALFTDPKFVEAWQWLVDLDLKHHVATKPEDEAAMGAEGPYLSGKVGMTWMWNLYGTMKKAPFKWTVIAPPFKGLRPNKYGGNSWTISSATKNQQPAWEFVKWAATNLEGQKAFAAAGTIPAYAPEGLLPAAESDGQKTLWQVIIDRQKAAVQDKVSRPFSFGAHGNEITDILNAENDLIYNGKETVDAGLAKAKQKVDKLFAGA